MNTLFKYAVAVMLPPAGLYLAGRKVSSVVASFLYVAALLTIGDGIGAVVLFFLIAWAVKSVGEQHAREEVKHFLAAMNARPVEVLRHKNHAA